MYLAKERIRGRVHYVIRESYTDGEVIRSRDLFHLGANPSDYISYTGRVGFIIDEEVEEGVRLSGGDPDPFELEKVFRPFLKPRVRKVISRFEGRTRAAERGHGLSREDLKRAHAGIHRFDKRRLFFLKYGYAPPPGARYNKPFGCFNVCLGKSRDEIEHLIMAAEAGIPPVEYKGYVFAAFDLFRFFPGHLARLAPQAVDLSEADERFMEELCRTNSDGRFFSGQELPSGLSWYLKRYAIMYFDYEWPESSPWERYILDFINRHRQYRPPAKKRTDAEIHEAMELFEVTREKLGSMTRGEITKIFRQKAMMLHPDTGGDHEEFVVLARAYETLMECVKG